MTELTYTGYGFDQDELLQHINPDLKTYVKDIFDQIKLLMEHGETNLKYKDKYNYSIIQPYDIQKFKPNFNQLFLITDNDSLLSATDKNNLLFDIIYNFDPDLKDWITLNVEIELKNAIREVATDVNTYVDYKPSDKTDTLTNKLISLRKTQEQQKIDLLKSIIVEYLTQSYLSYQPKVNIKTYDFIIETKTVVYLECDKSVKTKVKDFIRDIYTQYPEHISEPCITYNPEKCTIDFSTRLHSNDFKECLDSVVKDEPLFNVTKRNKNSNDYYTIEFNTID